MKLLVQIIMPFSCLILNSCANSKINSSGSSKIIYNERFSNDENLKITYFFSRDCKSFYTSLYKEKKLVTTFELKDCPRRFGIDKRSISDGAANYTYRMVTDTFQNQFKCVDYNFLPQYCNSTVAKSFIPISEKEREIMEILRKAVQSGRYGVDIEVHDINRFIGWVKISY